jgi:hypothetical protein
MTEYFYLALESEWTGAANEIFTECLRTGISTEYSLSEIGYSILLQLLILSIGGTISYLAGHVFSYALEDIERLIRSINRFLNIKSL